MFSFSRYPFTSFEQINLNWIMTILNKLKDAIPMVQDAESIYQEAVTLTSTLPTRMTEVEAAASYAVTTANTASGVATTASETAQSAATSASNAATSASGSATSASAAATSASNAAASASNAAASANEASASASDSLAAINTAIAGITTGGCALIPLGSTTTTSDYIYFGDLTVYSAIICNIKLDGGSGDRYMDTVFVSPEQLSSDLYVIPMILTNGWGLNTPISLPVITIDNSKCTLGTVIEGKTITLTVYGIRKPL